MFKLGVFRFLPGPNLEAARREIEKAALRRAIFEAAWERAHPAGENIPAQPCPSLSDNEIRRRLHDLLF